MLGSANGWSEDASIKADFVSAGGNSNEEIRDFLQKLLESVPDDQPVYMLNMQKFRDKAEYPEGNEYADKGWTGKQAYAEYSRLVGPMVISQGAERVAAWRPLPVVAGAPGREWDAIFVVRYPTPKAFIDMIASDAYQRVSFHRKAGLEYASVVRMAGMEGSTSSDVSNAFSGSAK